MSNSHAAMKTLAIDPSSGPARTQVFVRSELRWRKYSSGADSGEKTNRASVHSPDRPIHDRHSIDPDETTSSPPLDVVRKPAILCVDDDIEGTRMRGHFLEEEGYSVVLYHCPLAALRCDLSIFSLAILDFEMPELNGRELLLRMRALGARFPIVLLSGYANSLSRENRALFARCIDKGSPTRYLLETIAEFIGKDQIPDFGSERKDHRDSLRSDRRR